VYVDAATADIRRWYVERFLRLRETAFRNPASYFAKYAHLTEDEAVAEANRIWDEINGPNLKQNVQPTRGRATLVLRKAADHSVRFVRLRKL
jgi:type I pantothenate kinase